MNRHRDRLINANGKYELTEEDKSSAKFAQFLDPKFLKKLENLDDSASQRNFYKLLVAFIRDTLGIHLKSNMTNSLELAQEHRSTYFDYIKEGLKSPPANAVVEFSELLSFCTRGYPPSTHCLIISNARILDGSRTSIR